MNQRFRNRTLALALGLISGWGAIAQPYKNAKLATEQRLQDLLGRMTLEEKVAQMQCLWLQKKNVLDDKGNVDPKKAKEVLKNGIGQIARPSEVVGSITKSRSPKETALFTNQFQKFIIENTRLGIPILFHEESLHGNQAKDATHFPSPLGLASSWNPELMTQIYTAVAKEVRARGAQQVLAPVVDLGRDPRWGRTEETLGEDPYLVSRLAVAQIKAYQGDNAEFGKHKVAATIKHFGVHGQSEGGINVAPANIDERTRREYFYVPFKAAIQEAKVSSLMPCYNEVDGLPVHANRAMLTGILRNEWGFRGTIVSDYMAINDFHGVHKMVKKEDSLKMAQMAFSAGVDIELPDPFAFPKIVQLVKEGKISQRDLDSSVARQLRLKFRLGLFDNPYVDVNEAEKVIGSAEHRAIATDAARQAITLLKNDAQTLPFQKGKYKTIAVIGPNADRCILGGYSNEPKQRVTPFEAIKKLAGAGTNVVYAEGVRITDSGDWFSDKAELSKPEENRRRIQEAMQIAMKADAIVLCVGGNEATSREAWSKEHAGDLTTLELLGEQNELVKAVAGLGKPVAAFVFSGPPIAFRYLNESVPAVVNCFYLGQETGTAVAEVLFGDYNPSGKLPITIPRSVGHIPAYYNFKPSSRRNYHFETPDPLYAFGYGLSYTNFSISEPTLSAKSIKAGNNVKVSVTVKNIGSRAGTEVVQVYVRDIEASVTRPVKELKAFQRVNLQPNESKTVTLTLPAEAFKLWNAEMKEVIEAGDFEIMVGNSSQNVKTTLLTLTP